LQKKIPRNNLPVFYDLVKVLDIAEEAQKVHIHVEWLDGALCIWKYDRNSGMQMFV
jgi:hypothetical protein